MKKWSNRLITSAKLDFEKKLDIVVIEKKLDIVVIKKSIITIRRIKGHQKQFFVNTSLTVTFTEKI